VATLVRRFSGFPPFAGMTSGAFQAELPERWNLFVNIPIARIRFSLPFGPFVDVVLTMGPPMEFVTRIAPVRREKPHTPSAI